MPLRRFVVENVTNRLLLLVRPLPIFAIDPRWLSVSRVEKAIRPVVAESEANHEAKNPKRRKSATSKRMREFLNNVSQAEANAEAARLRAQESKAQFRSDRKAFKEAKRHAKQARKEAKAAAKALKAGMVERKR